MNKFIVLLSLSSLVFITGCSTRGTKVYHANDNVTTKKSYSTDKRNHSPEASQKTYSHPTMKPYIIRGIRYHPQMVRVGDTFEGNASWYGPDFHGKLTSNGETYNMHDMTAAHKTLPMNTIVKVTNKRNGLTTVVRINDRGPFVATRIIDLSKSAAKEIEMLGAGTAPVSIEVLGFEVKGKKSIPTPQELHDAPQIKSYGSFAIQIASFSRIEGAMATQEKYDNTDGYRTIIKDVATKDGRIFKVWLKGFGSEEEARDYKAQGHFENAFIVGEE